jgi:hypothetical protein
VRHLWKGGCGGEDAARGRRNVVSVCMICNPHNHGLLMSGGIVILQKLYSWVGLELKGVVRSCAAEQPCAKENYVTRRDVRGKMPKFILYSHPVLRQL